MIFIALKYHPDRNPGKEVEFNAKFQEIQSAHEVLADPAQRAKYDADRIRAGLLHTYTTTARPNVPPRAFNPAAFNSAAGFPPPPRTPATSTKPASSSTSTPSSTANRYSGFTPTSSWAGNKDDTQTRAGTSKAWEQMKPAQTPQGRTVPPKWAQGSRDQSFQPDSRPKLRPSWEQFQDSYSGFPGMSRANTSRTPKRQGFAPATPRGNEPQARNTSAYSNISRGDRPQASRAQTQFPPPPKGQAPTAKKTDAASRFRGQPGLSNPFVNSERLSTPYATGGGERTYFSSSGLNRSASTREKNQGAEQNGNGSTKVTSPHSHTGDGRHHSASPKMRHSGPQRSYSTSSSSSDDSVQSGEEKISTPLMPKASGVQSDSAQASLDGHRRPSLNSYPKVEKDVESGADELRPNVQPNWSGRSNGWTHETRKQAASEDYSFRGRRPDGPEGFLQHRVKLDAERNQQQATNQGPASAHRRSSADDHVPSPSPMEKSRSWQEKYRAQESLNDQKDSANTQGRNGKDTMYDFPGCIPSPNTLSSNKWSDQWPFKSPKKPGGHSALPPYWAIPSSVTPRNLAGPWETSPKPHYWIKANLDDILREANLYSPHSFTFPVSSETFAGPPPLRSQSSGTINTDFSPSHWNGKFTGDGEYFAPPRTSRATTPRQRTSPSKGRRAPSQQSPPLNNTENLPNGNTQMHPPPAFPIPAPAPSQVKFSAEEWRRHFHEGTFAWPPPPPGSPGRTATLKRPKTPRRPSKSSKKRPTVPKPASVSATVDDSGEEPAVNDTGSNIESVSSCYTSATSGDGGAMDVDPALTPPNQRAQQSQNAAMDQRTDLAGSETTPRSQAPPVPPRHDGHSQAEFAGDTNASNLNLGNLKNVAPLAPGNEGLKDLGDLSNTLPFESRPANTAAQAPRPQRLHLPMPPRAPSTPETLNQSSWESYIAQMRNYIYHWNGYNRKMLKHFEARQTFVETELGPSWMTAAGEGYAKYMQGVEDDFRVREHWSLSWEKHQEAMKGLGSVRERLLKSSIVV